MPPVSGMICALTYILRRSGCRLPIQADSPERQGNKWEDPPVMKALWLSVRNVAVAFLCMIAAPGHAGDNPMDAAAGLRAKYDALRDQLDNSSFNKPLRLDSRESRNSVAGEIHALIDHPFATVAGTLNSAGDWCGILFLHLNTKYCRPTSGSLGMVLNVGIGKKHDQPVDKAYRVVFVYRVAAQSANYLQARLNADQGPLSTRDYRIVLEAVPVNRDRTFIRLSYSYTFGAVGRLAMGAYLGTIGKSKVGFTVTGRGANGQPQYIGGVRGVLERNVLRYFLAIEVHLGALSVPPLARLEKRLRDWFAAAERYPRQLHEIDLDEYLVMKRREAARQDDASNFPTSVHLP